MGMEKMPPFPGGKRESAARKLPEQKSVPAEHPKQKQREKPHHVGEGAPLSEAQERVKEIGEKMTEKEEAARQARIAGKPQQAQTLEEEIAGLKAERQEVLQDIAKSRHSGL